MFFALAPGSLVREQAAEQVITGSVYWSPYGKVYHTHDDCQALNQSEQLTTGDVDQAIAAGRTRLCSFCAKRDDFLRRPVQTLEAPVGLIDADFKTIEATALRDVEEFLEWFSCRNCFFVECQ